MLYPSIVSTALDSSALASIWVSTGTLRSRTGVIRIFSDRWVEGTRYLFELTKRSRSSFSWPEGDDEMTCTMDCVSTL